MNCSCFSIESCLASEALRGNFSNLRDWVVALIRALKRPTAQVKRPSNRDMIICITQGIGNQRLPLVSTAVTRENPVIISGPVYPKQNITPPWVRDQMFICRRDMRISWTRWETPPCLLFLFFRSFFRNVERHNHEAWTLWSIVSHKGLDRKCFAGNWGSFVIIWTLSFLCERKKPSRMEDRNLVSFSRACPVIQLPCRNKGRTIPSEYYIPKMMTMPDSTVINSLWLSDYKYTLHRDPFFFPFSDVIDITEQKQRDKQWYRFLWVNREVAN